MDSYLLAEFRRQADAHRAPAYQHLRRALQHAIEHGVLGIGQALPPERELAALTGLSRVTVRKAIAGLPEQQRTVLALCYFEELTLRQIAEVLHVTESRISQVRTAALKRLREILAADGFVP